jgi:hypothetical protein
MSAEPNSLIYPFRVSASNPHFRVALFYHFELDFGLGLAGPWITPSIGFNTNPNRSPAQVVLSVFRKAI